MIIAPIPDDEAARLALLEKYSLKGPGREPAFDRIAECAAEIFEAPIALVSIVNSGAQCFRGRAGTGLEQTSRDTAFCAFAILSDDVMIVPDATRDQRFHDNPLVIGKPFIRFYAGAPITIHGHRIGTLCIIDTRTREFTAKDARALRALSRTIEVMIEARDDKILAETLEQRLGAVTNAMPAALSVWDADDRLISYNDAFRDLFGGRIEVADFIGASFPEMLDKIAHEGLTAYVDGRETRHWMKRLLVRGAQGARRFELRMPGDLWLSVRERVSPNGELIVIFSDVTDLKKREADLELHASLMRTTIENIGYGIVVFDASRRLMLTNDRFYELLNLPGHLRLQGAYLDDFLAGVAETVGAPPGDIGKMLDAGEIWKITPPTRSGQFVEMKSISLDDGRIILISEDVSKQRQIERMKNEFVSTVSHELRTPITSINGALALLNKGLAGELSEKAARLVTIALSNTERLMRLVNDLLEIDRIESGTIKLNRQILELQSVLEESAAQNRPFAEKFGVTIRLAGSSTPVHVFADRDRLLQIAANLISNAIKYSPQGDEVVIEIGERNGDAVFSVTDHGPGIPAAFQPRIFERFAQADSSDRRAHYGTGLGLSITRGLVERHGGRISFETAEGAGARFDVVLPRVEADQPPRRLVICASDPLPMKAILERLLEKGVEVIGVSDIAAVRNALEKGGIGALIIDPILPDGDVPSLIRSIRESSATDDLPIVLFSGRQIGEDETMFGGAVEVIDWLNKQELAPHIAASARMVSAQHRGRTRILHVEDERDLSELLASALEANSDLIRATDIATARRLLETESFDAVILDLVLPDGNGADLLPQIAALPGPPVPVVLFSGAESDATLAANVKMALTKSRCTVDQLAQIVQEIASGAKIPEPEAAK